MKSEQEKNKTEKEKKKQGFALMTAERLKEVTKKGGKISGEARRVQSK